MKKSGKSKSKKMVLCRLGTSVFVVPEKTFWQKMVTPIVTRCISQGRIVDIGNGFERVESRYGVHTVRDHSDRSPEILKIMVPGLTQIKKDCKAISYEFNVQTFLNKDPNAFELSCFLQVNKKMGDLITSMAKKLNKRLKVQTSEKARVAQSMRIHNAIVRQQQQH